MMRTNMNDAMTSFYNDFCKAIGAQGFNPEGKLPETKIATIESMLGLPTPGVVNILVVTNKAGMFGAINILDDGVLERIYDLYEEPFYIVPSAIHEVLCVRESTATPAQIYGIKGDVDSTEVEDSDQMPHTIYRFDGTEFTVLN